MAIVYQRPAALSDVDTHYCPGCTHGIVHRLVAEVLDELGIAGKTIGVASVGCSVFSYNYFECDMIQAAHGRAPAVATGAKRANPSQIVFTYQGDGDLAAIGTAETVHAATRGENITIIFINNAIYGMTSGQMAPTTLPGQVTTTTPYGRDPKLAGYPVRVCEMLATLRGTAYAERVSVDSVPNVMNAKKAIKKAARKHRNKLAAGPAKETFKIPSRRLRKLFTLMGTPFAQPKPATTKRIAPMGSKCAKGLKVNRPI